MENLSNMIKEYEVDNQCDRDLKKYVGVKLLLGPHIAGNTYEPIRQTSEVVINKLALLAMKKLN